MKYELAADVESLAALKEPVRFSSTSEEIILLPNKDGKLGRVAIQAPVTTRCPAPALGGCESA